MKKNIKPLINQYKSPKIFLSDLVEIEEVLIKGGFSDIKIIADDFEYEGSSELNKVKKPINSLQINNHNPFYISLKLSSTENKLYIDKDDDLLRQGVFGSIDKILKRRERKIVWFLFYFLLIFSVLVFALPIVIGLVLLVIDFNIKNFLISLFISIVGFFLTKTIINHGPAVFGCEKEDKIKGFWKRNKDKIILIVITAIVTTLLNHLDDWILISK